MSKFLKFIVGLILIIFIGSGAALIVPQFVGSMDTVIVQENMVSNRSVGSVIYCKKEAVSDLQIGDKVLDMDTDSLFVHEVLSYDSVTQTAQVTGGMATSVRLSDNYTRVVFSVPLIGFLMIATQSLPGLILLGLLLAFVIFLFVASEILRRTRPDDDYEEDDVFDHSRDREDDDFYSGLAEKKRQTGMIGEVPGSVADSVSRIVAEDKDVPNPPAGLFAEGANETGTGRANRLREVTAGEAARAANGMLDLSKDAAPLNEVQVGKDEKPLGTGELPDVQTALEAALENQQLNRTEPRRTPEVQFAQEIPEDIPAVPDENGEIELAMPVHTAEELISKAYAEGLDPVVKEDKQNGITFVDYSDTI